MDGSGAFSFTANNFSILNITSAGYTPPLSFESTPVPEPASLILLGAGLCLMSREIRRRRPRASGHRTP